MFFSLQQGLNFMTEDICETLDTFDGLQTVRGTILLDYTMLKRVTSKIREAIVMKSDFYYQDNDEYLQEILGKRHSELSTRHNLVAFPGRVKWSSLMLGVNVWVQEPMRGATIDLL